MIPQSAIDEVRALAEHDEEMYQEAKRQHENEARCYKEFELFIGNIVMLDRASYERLKLNMWVAFRAGWLAGLKEQERNNL